MGYEVIPNKTCNACMTVIKGGGICPTCYATDHREDMVKPIKEYKQTIDSDVYAIKKYADGSFRVGSYTVIDGKCSCPANAVRGVRCKHIKAVDPNEPKEDKYLISLGAATKVANALVKELEPLADRVFIGGKIARRKTKVGDIDIAVIPKDMDAMKKKISELGIVRRGGDRKFNILMGNGKIRANIYFGEEDTWGATRMFVTGSKEYLRNMKNFAKNRNYTLNQYGLWDNKTNKLISSTENGIHKALNWDVKPVTER